MGQAPHPETRRREHAAGEGVRPERLRAAPDEGAAPRAEYLERAGQQAAPRARRDAGGEGCCGRHGGGRPGARPRGQG